MKSINRHALRILNVEDSEDDSLLLQAVLAAELGPLEVRRVENAEDMRKALESDWDAVISDHSMPRFDSFRALEVLRQSGRDIPFIICSGEIGQDRGTTAMRAGAEDVVEKHNTARLVPVIARALQHTSDRRARNAAEADAVRSANCDFLTGLHNRRRFEQVVAESLAARPEAAMIHLDIDRFMRINDSFGYSAGDQLLCQVAERLQRHVHADESLARIGHDEFAILVPGAALRSEALASAERLKQTFGESFQVNGQSLFLTVSVGAARAPDDGTDPAALFRNAEAAMFSAKRLGRNSVQLYVCELNRDAGMRLRLENALRHAVERDELSVAYQPIIDVASGKVCGAEALVRWKHPELGWIPPDQFISIADESGQILEVGDWVLRNAASQMHRWHQQGWQDLSIAVNFSATQFKQPGFDERVRHTLDASGLDPRHFELEITETLAMQNAESSVEMLRRLKDLGVRVSIDDFGTGYSSLGYLRRFPIDILKIDRSFVRDADRDADSAAIVRTIVALARSLKLIVLAEGVETREHFELLCREGVDRMQGYYFARPCDAAGFEYYIAERGACRPQPMLRLAGF